MAGIQRFYKLRPSRSLAFLLSLLCLVAVVAIWGLPVPTTVMAALTLVVLCCGGYYLLLGASLSLGRSCVAFRLEGGDEIVLLLRNGRHLACRLSADTLVTPYVVVLNVVLKERRGRRTLLIMRDAMRPESLRRLRVALRWADETDQAAA